MTTKKQRIPITFNASTTSLLFDLAKQLRKPVASLIEQFVLEALEMREDLYLSKIAEELDKEGAKTYSHSEVWKQ